MRLISGSDLYHALKDEGFELPPNCGDVEMVIPVDGVIKLKYIENLEGDRLAQFGRALQRLGQEAGSGQIVGNFAGRLPARQPDTTTRGDAE